MSAIRVAPITLRAANAWVEKLHRHHGSVRGHRLSLSVVDARGDVHGVAILGRPVSRMLDQAGCIEVLRVATDGTPNACSMLYGAARRVAREMGYEPHQVITYTLASELGMSLRASGWVPVAAVRGESWDRPGRMRVDKHPTDAKVRWAAGVDAAA
ncbi:XF1762 family protein [Cellulosimicrobium sp. TH-20]|uniref:XF1762 family protein n=1 Tax=Cellulosimicrobium sp. TH-20 TaxID=1980001 RepID=UPI00319EB8E3